MGTIWRRSGSFEFDANGERAGGAKAYFFEGNTTTPLTVYQDATLDTPHDIPLVANGVGRWPAVYIDFIDTYDELIKTSAAVELTYYTGIPNPDPNFTATVDVETPAALQTGDWKFSDVDEAKVGFVRANGRTIGNAGSGASERAHADCEALFTYRWNKLGNGQAAVSGGRGASAAADWAANKTIALPDMRGCALVGLDTMGAATASRLSSAPFTHGSAATAGSLCGLNTHTLTEAQLPTITPAGSVSTPAGTIAYAGNFTPAGGVSTPTGTISTPSITVQQNLFATPSNISSGGGVTVYAPGSNPIGLTASSSTPTFTGDAVTFTGTSAALPAATFTGSAATFTGNSIGSGSVHNNVSSAVLGTVYIKL